MTIQVSIQEQTAFRAFLDEVMGIRLPRERRRALQDIRDGIAAGKLEVRQTNAANTLPLLMVVVNTAWTSLDSLCKWRKIPLWQKLLLLPALWTRFVTMRRFYKQKAAQLTLVAGVVKRMQHTLKEQQVKA